MHKLSTLSLLLSLLGGCSAAKNSALGTADTGADDAVGGGLDSDPGDTAEDGDTAPDGAAQWWLLEAALVLEAGQPTAASTLRILPLDAEGAVICTPDVPSAVVSASTEESPHETILSWWRLTLALPTSLCDGSPVPLDTVVYLGIGQPHPDILAAMGSVEGLDPALPLNGAFLSRSSPAEELLVFGVAGPEVAFKGSGSVADAVPLADGTWLVRSVYWLSF